VPELQRLHPRHAPAVLAFELANRSYFAAFISDPGDEFFDQFRAAAEGVASQRAVPVAVPSRVRLSAAQGCLGVGWKARHPQPRPFLR
jgi:hypothetical protein